MNGTTQLQKEECGLESKLTTQQEDNSMNHYDNTMNNFLLQEKLNSIIPVYPNDDSLEIARKFVAAAFSGRPLIDTRNSIPPEVKPEWKSGGSRNPYGSTAKFNNSRANLAWVSKWPERESYISDKGEEEQRTVWNHHTKNTGRNRIKQVAKDLGKLHGLSYGKSLRYLEYRINENLARKEKEESNGAA